MNDVVINPRERILPHFWDLYKSQKTNKIKWGSRSSGKSEETADELVHDFLKIPDGNVICFRRYQNTLLKSSYEAIRKAIHRIGIEDEFDFIESRLIIEDKTNNTRFYFFGLDDVNKIKSTLMKTGFPCRYWFEEFQENDTLDLLDVIDDVVVTFERELLPKGVKHIFHYTLNRPRNPYHVINIWLDKHIEQNDEDTIIHYSTYEDVKDKNGKVLISEQILKRIEKLKERDYDTYLWRFQGMAVGEQLKIYNEKLLKVVKELPSGEHIVKQEFIADTGYMTSATAYQIWGITNKTNLVLIDTWYYLPTHETLKRIPRELHPYIQAARGESERLAPSHMSKKFYEFVFDNKYPISNYYIDSAEGGLRVQVFRDYGIRIKPVAKLEKEEMIELSRSVAAEFQVYVLDKPQNKIFIWEYGKYQWDAKTLKSQKPKVIKEDDHTVDDYQYICVMNRKLLGV